MRSLWPVLALVPIALLACGPPPPPADPRPAEELDANVWLGVYCRHLGSDACDRVVIDVQNVRPRPARLTASLWGRDIHLEALGGRPGRKPKRGSFWRGQLPHAGLRAPPLRYRSWDLTEPKPRAPISVELRARLKDGSVAGTTVDVDLTIPDMAETYRDRKLGVSASVPFRHTTAPSRQPVAGWRVARRPLTPTLVLPREVFAAGTFRMRPGGSCAPATAIRDMRRADVLVTVQEFPSRPRPDARFPSRPRRFREDPGNFECFAFRQVAVTLTPFSDSGRRFYAILASGDRAGPKVVRQARGILAAMRFDSAEKVGDERAR